MTRFLVALLVTSSVALPAAAQNSKRRPVQPENAERVASIGGPFGNDEYASGLPGVGLSGNQQTERPSGPGGLSNGIGAVGTSMPNSTSSNGQIVSDEGHGVGIPLGRPRAYRQ